MANELVRFTTGLKSDLANESKVAGKVLFALNDDNSTGSIYFDKDSTHRYRMSYDLKNATNSFSESAANVSTTSGRTYPVALDQDGYLAVNIPWTDERVYQQLTSTNAEYRLLFSETADNVNRYESARKDGDLSYNPSTNVMKIGPLTVTGGTTNSSISSTGTLTVSSGSTLYINRANSTSILFQLAGSTKMRIDTANAFRPETNNTLSIGTSSYKWKEMYATTFYGNLSGHATSATTASKLDTNAGNSTTPVYFANGIPVALTGALDNDIAGNAATASAFETDATVALTGDVTGTSAGSPHSWSVATTLANSGVTAGSYGPTGNASPAHSGTFTVPQITVDAKGRVTAASTKTITLPASGNTDAKVAQTITSTDAAYRVIFSNSANNTTETAGVRKDGDFTYNPSTNTLVVPNITATLTGNVTGNVTGDLTGTASNAIIASKLDTNAGSTTQPIYFANGVPVAIIGSIANSTTGNAATATAFSSNATVALTGDVTGTSAGSTKSWSVTTTLANSGVTAGSYGPTGNVSPAHSGTFTVPQITVDAKGRVTAASTKTITLPASGNVDTKVTQTANSADKNYRVLFSVTDSNDTKTEGAYKNGDFLYNPSTKVLSVSNITATLTGNVTGDVTGNLTGTASRATIADKLDANAGSATQPIYFANGVPTAITGNIANGTTGNAATATKFSSNATVTLTGDATGTSAGSTKSWSVPVTLAASGVTAGSYGPDSNASPAHSGTFTVPYITVDAKGRVTAASTKTITLPASGNVDTKVTQTANSANKNYRILFSITDSNDTKTEGAYKSGDLLYNPSTKVLSVPNITATLTGNVTGNVTGDLTGTASNAITASKLDTNAGSATQPIYFANGVPTAITGNIANGTTGNAATATQFSSNATVTLTGDVTGTSAGSKKSWSVATTLADSGVTAGSYGPTGNASPAHSGTFTVPYITVDSKGRITAASTKTITLPASGNTDTKVTQTAVTASSYTNWRSLIFGASNSATEGFTPSTVTDQVYSTNVLSVQPSTGTIKATTFKGNLTGNVTGNVTGNLTGTASYATTAAKLDTNAGSSTQPIYFANGVPTAITGNIANGTTGNAATATAFSSNATVTLTGDATGTSAGSTKSWSVPVTLANSGVTAGSYGPTGNASPAHSGTFTVPQITVDAKGRVTAASTKTITLPASGNVDTKVTQTANSADKNYRILFSVTDSNDTKTEGAYKSGDLLYNPSTKILSVPNITATLTGNVTGNVTGDLTGTASNAIIASKLDSNAGSATQPIYFANGVPVAITGNIANGTTGNAATATQFSSNATVTLTGDVTGTSAGSKKSWSVATTLANSGVTAGSYGPTDNASPAHSGTFTVPYITVDAKGRITAASTKTITLPASGNTDTKVTQSVTTTANWRKVLLHYKDDTTWNADVTSSTNVVYAAKSISVQPSTGTLKAAAFQGPLTGNVTGNVTGDLTGTASRATIAAKLDANAGSSTQPIYFANGVPTAITGDIANGTTGNAATATAFSSNATVALTGDVTGTSAGSTKSWSVATTLANSGVTAGSYGPTGNASPAHSGTFTVPQITVDAKGRVTAASTKTITLPASGNTDTKVTQTANADNKNYRVLFSVTDSNDTKTESAYKDGDLVYNPNLNRLTVTHATGKSGELRTIFGTTVDMWMGVGSGDVNHGLYDAKADKWMVYADGSGNVTLNGNAATASRATIAAKLDTNAGSNTQPVYFANGVPVAVTGTIGNSISGNAATATKFASAQSITLTGDVTGSASSQAGWSIATTLKNSGVTAGSYGPSENASPSFGGTFLVPYITVDAKGRITAASGKTITVPAYSQGTGITISSGTIGLTNNSISVAGNNITLGGSLDAATLRSSLGLSSALRYIGKATQSISDGGTQDPGITGYTTKTTGDVILDSSSSMEYVWTGSAWERLGSETSFKTIQSAVSDPTASGNATSFIDTISQSANGNITVTKKTVPTASTSTAGIIQITKGNLNTFINQLDTGSSTPVDADYYISQYVNGGTTTTTYHRRPMSALWTYVKGKINGTGTAAANAFTISITGNAATATNAAVADKLTTSNKGSTTKPIYLASGVATECSTYAGGTAVTLNGAGKGGSTASFYAPVSGGTSGQYLVSGGTGAPTWTSLPAVNTVKQNSKTDDYEYPIILKTSANTTAQTGELNFNGSANKQTTINPSTGTISAKDYKVESRVQIKYDVTTDSLNFVFI